MLVMDLIGYDRDRNICISSKCTYWQLAHPVTEFRQEAVQIYTNVTAIELQSENT